MAILAMLEHGRDARCTKASRVAKNLRWLARSSTIHAKWQNVGCRFA
jgi:hypothetical protein